MRGCVDSRVTVRRTGILLFIGAIAALLTACRSEPEPAPWTNYWDNELDTQARLAMFDAFWLDYRQHYAAFVASEVDWDALRAELEPQIVNTDSYGEMYRQYSHVFLGLRNTWNVFSSERVCSSPIEDRPPVFWTYDLGALEKWNGWPLRGHNAARDLGLCVTATAADTGLVYHVEPDNPAGLEQGDEILGYDGLSLREVLRRDLEYPICGRQASHPQAQDALLLAAAAANFHLYESMDVRRSRTGEIDSIPTDDLFGYRYDRKLCTDQVEAAVPPAWTSWDDLGQETSPVSYGVLIGHNVGYISISSFLFDAGDKFDQAVQDLWNTRGLIIDLRFNLVGDPWVLVPGAARLFQDDITDVYYFAGRDSLDDPYSLRVDPPSDVTVDPNTYYDHPIAILTGPQAIGGGDGVPYYLAQHPRARRFGRPTSGSSCVGPDEDLWRPDPYASDLTAHRTTCTGLAVNQAPFVNFIRPDERIWLIPQDVAAGEDTVVEAALTWIDWENTIPN